MMNQDFMMGRSRPAGLFVTIPLAAGLLLAVSPQVVHVLGLLPLGPAMTDVLEVAGFTLVIMALFLWRSPIRCLTRTLGRSVEALARIIPARVMGLGDRWLSDHTLEARVARMFRNHADPLLAGDRYRFAQAEWPVSQWPTLYLDIPADLRRPLLWDGRTLGGRPAAWLAWRHFTPEVTGNALRTGMRAGVAWGLAVMLFLLLVTALRAAQGGPGPHPYPHWALEAGVSGPVLWWYIERIASVAIGTGQGLLLTLVAAVAAGMAAGYFKAAEVLRDWWRSSSRELRTGTQGSQCAYLTRVEIRSSEYLSYVRQVQAAVGRLAEQPLLPIGTATGALRARGDMESPTAGQIVALDGESIRQHVLALGAAGSGKTRLLMAPLFHNVMTADWGRFHRIGAMVIDGKGTLWRDLHPFVQQRSDVCVVGTAEGQQGVDLLAGMTPLEVASTLRSTAGQAGLAGAIDAAWSEPLSLLVMHAATLCRALDADPQTAATCEGLGFRPWSLVGINHFAASSEIQADALDRLRALRRGASGEAPALTESLASHELWSSVQWLETDWRQMAHDTRAGIIAALSTVLGPLANAGELCRRFASGLYPDCLEISHALDGGIVLVAVGETEWGSAGGIVTRWIKSRLFALARRKLEADRERFRDTSTALFADDYQMLATTGPDGDGAFLSIARETGIFLVAATRSLGALRQVLGDEPTQTLLESIRTKVVLQTQEHEAFEHLVKISGDLLEPPTEGETPESQAGLVRELPDLARQLPTAERAISWSLIPRILDFGEDEDCIPSTDYDKAACARNMGQPAARIIQRLRAWRVDDRAEPTTAAVCSRPGLTRNDLVLGSGLAFATVRRAGADRTDIIDLAGTTS